MLTIHDLSEFIVSANNAQSEPELVSSLQTVMRKVGATHYACSSYASPSDNNPNVIFTENYPDQWTRHYVSNRLHTIDPIFNQMTDAQRPISWDDPKIIFQCSRSQEEFMNDAKDAGLQNGISFPIRSPGAIPATLSLCFDHDDRDAETTNTLHLVAVYFHEKMVHLRLAEPKPPEINLTARQTQALEWVSAGKSNWEISRILNISEATVDTHIQQAMQRLGASTRAHAIARAIRLGLLAQEEFKNKK